MIVREWRGRADPAAAEAYPKHFREQVVPELRRLTGFAGAQLARRQIGGKMEFFVLTRWQSIDAIRAFAGLDVEKAVVEPGAVAALTDFDPRARHYEVIEEVPPPQQPRSRRRLR
ncbi:MAG: antibiotic biosynthesis monooxygenase [Xanthobacteraceae bacterium]